MFARVEDGLGFEHSRDFLDQIAHAPSVSTIPACAPPKILKFKNPVDTSFIPQFILQKTKANFLTKEQALNIAKSKFKKQGLKIESRIYYDPQRKEYVWEITNILEEFADGSRSVEFIKINPITGETIKILDAIQGQVH